MEREGKVSVPKAIGQLASVQGEDPIVWGGSEGKRPAEISERCHVD